MKRKSKDEQIKINLEDLNLELIQKTMKNLGWTWRDSKTGERRVPNKQEIAIVAADCMNKAFQSDIGHARMGNFEAEVIQGVVEIKFIFTKASPLSKLLG
jgi:hypothetical protein